MVWMVLSVVFMFEEVSLAHLTVSEPDHQSRVLQNSELTSLTMLGLLKLLNELFFTLEPNLEKLVTFICMDKD